MPSATSCVRTATRVRLSCHKEDASEYTRDDMQTGSTSRSRAVAKASATTTGALNAVATDLGLTGVEQLHRRSAQDRSPRARCRRRAGRCCSTPRRTSDIVINDASSGGIHNPAYALAGLAKAQLWAASTTADPRRHPSDAGPALERRHQCHRLAPRRVGAAIPGCRGRARDEHRRRRRGRDSRSRASRTAPARSRFLRGASLATATLPRALHAFGRRRLRLHAHAGHSPGHHGNGHPGGCQRVVARRPQRAGDVVCHAGLG